MTAFTIETLLLLVIAFILGLSLGLALIRRRAARRAEAEVVSPLAAVTLLGPAEQEGGSPRPPDPEQPPEPAVQAPVPAPQPPAAAGPEPDLFSRLDPEAEPAPADAPAPVGSDGHPGRRPPVLAAPEGEAADDLKLLKGIGPQNERRLHALGIFHFRQIAAWTPDEALWVGSYLAFPGRIEREDWIGQAKAIVEGGAAPEPTGRRRR